MEVQLWEAGPAPAVERLARIEGQSNFLSLLAGIEAGPDTTQDMAALGLIRRRCIPESLEAYWAGSRLYRDALCRLVLDALAGELGAIKERDRVWAKAAVLDAFELFVAGRCSPAQARARQFKVDNHAFQALRKAAHGVFVRLEGDARPRWQHARCA